MDWINNKKTFSPEYVDLWYEDIQLTYRNHNMIAELKEQVAKGILAFFVLRKSQKEIIYDLQKLLVE